MEYKTHTGLLSTNPQHCSDNCCTCPWSCDNERQVSASSRHLLEHQWPDTNCHYWQLHGSHQIQNCMNSGPGHCHLMRHHRCALGHSPGTSCHPHLALNQLLVPSIMYCNLTLYKMYYISKTQVIRDVTSDQSMSSPWYFGGKQCLHLQGQEVVTGPWRWGLLTMKGQDQEDQKVVKWPPIKNHSLLLICLCALSYTIIAAQTLPGDRQQTDTEHCYIPQHRWRKNAYQQGWTPSPPSWTPTVPLSGCPGEG